MFVGVGVIDVRKNILYAVAVHGGVNAVEGVSVHAAHSISKHKTSP